MSSPFAVHITHGCTYVTMCISLFLRLRIKRRCGNGNWSKQRKCNARRSAPIDPRPVIRDPRSVHDLDSHTYIRPPKSNTSTTVSALRHAPALPPSPPPPTPSQHPPPAHPHPTNPPAVFTTRIGRPPLPTLPSQRLLPRHPTTASTRLRSLHTSSAHLFHLAFIPRASQTTPARHKSLSNRKQHVSHSTRPPPHPRRPRIHTRARTRGDAIQSAPPRMAQSLRHFPRPTQKPPRRHSHLRRPFHPVPHGQRPACLHFASHTDVAETRGKSQRAFVGIRHTHVRNRHTHTCVRRACRRRKPVCTCVATRTAVLGVWKAGVCACVYAESF